jgi:hypothetical protein
MATHSSDVPGQSAEEAQLASTFAANSTAVGSQGETGKIAAILGFLKNAIGVKDLGSLWVAYLCLINVGSQLTVSQSLETRFDILAASHSRPVSAILFLSWSTWSF